MTTFIVQVTNRTTGESRPITVESLSSLDAPTDALHAAFYAWGWRSTEAQPLPQEVEEAA